MDSCGGEGMPSRLVAGAAEWVVKPLVEMGKTRPRKGQV